MYQNKGQKSMEKIGAWWCVFALLLFLLPVHGQIVHSFCTTSFTRQKVPGQCRPLVKCVRFFHEIPKLRSRPCRLVSGDIGVCCPYVVLPPKHRETTRLLRAPPPPPVVIPPIKTQDIDTAARVAEVKAQQRRDLERRLKNAGVFVRKRTGPSVRHRHLQRSNNRARKLGRHAARVVDTSTNLVESFGLSRNQGKFALPTFGVSGTSLSSVSSPREETECEADNSGKKTKKNSRKTTTKCLSSNRFRTQDGSCNNIRHSHWGRANVALNRILPPDYEDGVSLPRGSVNNATTFSSLPSPRTLSTALISHEDHPNKEFTLLLMQWGQFLDHDLTHTPLNKGTLEEQEKDIEDKSDIQCCSSGLRLSSHLLHPECFPIDIPRNDLFFGRLNEQCMEFVRSMPAERPDCSLGPREQVNQITAFIDGSNVYGSEVSTSRRLRLGRRGRLRVTRFDNEDLLPLAPEECADHSKRHYCFAAGDLRCNEQPELTVMHTLWLREHNRLAAQLSLLNSHWGDERLYQEARKIVGAEMQHITYNEWLPIVLGMKYMEENKLKPTEDGSHSQLYDPEVDPSITNVFATAAFRFGHSLVQGTMEWYGLFGTLLKSLPLHQHQLSPFEIYEENSIDGFVRGLTTQPVQSMDSSFTPELTQRLFQGNNSNHGMDLVALNVQRGRDHGLPSYQEWRKVCGLPRISGWKQLASIVSSSQLVPRLQRLYRGNIEEVDLFIGGLIEKPIEGSLLGPTFQCLVGDQFRRLRLGDRFWYEETNQAGSLSSAQLKAIKEASLARVLCDNGDNLQLMQPLAFKAPEDMNEKAGCAGKAIPRVDLSPWKEEFGN